MHVPLEIGFWTDIRMKAFTRDVHNNDAGAWLARLREFIMTNPACRLVHNGSMPGYSAAELAAVMEATCSDRKLFSALVKHKYLSQRRKTWFLADYKKLPISAYFQERETELRRKREARERLYQAHMALLDIEVDAGRRADGGRTATRRPIGRTGSMYLGRPPDAPPGAPRRGVAGAALTRWGWFLKTFTEGVGDGEVVRMRNPERCALMLAELTEEEYMHLQFSLPKQVASTRWNKNPRFRPWSDNYLKHKQWMEIRFDPKASHADENLKKRPKNTRQEVQESPIEAGRRYLLAQLQDLDTPEEHKIHLRAAWEKLHPGDRPWEKAVSSHKK